MRPLLFFLALSVAAAPPAAAQIFLGASRIVAPDDDAGRTGTSADSTIDVRFVLDGSVLNAPSSAGALRASADSSDGGASTPATGRVGLQLLSPRSETALSAQIGVASTETTLEEGAAAAILSPGTGGGIFESGLLYLVQRIAGHGDSKEFVSNGYLYLSGSNATWSLENRLTAEAERRGLTRDSVLQELGLSSVEERVSVIGVGAGYRFDVLPGGDTEAEFGVTANVGLALRHLGGDLGADGFASFRDLMLRTEQRNFFGLEGGLQVRVKDVVAGMQVYWLNADRGVPGLGGIRLVAGLGAAVDLPSGRTAR